MRIVKMNNKTCLRLIELFRKERILWDPKNRNYHHRTCRGESWEKISCILNIPVCEIQAKMKSLMGSYRREKSRQRRSREPGSKRLHVSKWFAFHYFDFLSHRDNPNETLVTLDEEEPKFTFENSNFEYEDFELPTEDIFTEQKPVIDTKKRKIDCEDDIHPEQDVNQLSQSTHSTILPTNSITNVQKKEPDELSLYGELLVTKLRKFDHTNRLIICNKIDNLIFETELKLLTESKDSHQDPLAHDLPTTSRNGKKSLKSSSSHSSPLHSDFSEHPQSE